MPIETTILKINKALISAFAAIDSWFDQPDTILKQRSANHDWSPAEMLEHIMLTNHFFLELINNGGRRDILVANEKDITQKIPGCMLENAGMENIEAGFFPCDSFTELRPTGTKPLSEIREVLREQLYRCMCQLELLQHGKGADYPLNMNENGSDKAHACQYISFLALHAKRHAEQLEKYAPCRSETGHDSVCV